MGTNTINNTANIKYIPPTADISKIGILTVNNLVLWSLIILYINHKTVANNINMKIAPYNEFSVSKPKILAIT
jgi:hypothetical protein